MPPLLLGAKKNAGGTGTDFGPLGPQSRGQKISSPWFDGSWEITQGWGPSPYALEPEGHGYSHWHAGVDVGLDCGTQINLPGNFSTDGYVANALYLDNPSGYGTALIVQVSYWPSRDPSAPHGRVVDIYLGHLRTRIIGNGATMNPGQPIAISNNTGNSTGCHLHFEVRPPGSGYGTDIDPSAWLLYGASTQAQGTTITADQNPYNPLTQPSQWLEWQLVHDIQPPLQKVGNELLGIAQAGLGSAMMLGGFVMLGAGVRGMSAGQLGSSARRALTAPPARPGPLVKPPAETVASEPTDATYPLTEQTRQEVAAAQAGRGARLSPQAKQELTGRTPSEIQEAMRSRVRPSHQARYTPAFQPNAKAPKGGKPKNATRSRG